MKIGLKSNLTEVTEKKNMDMVSSQTKTVLSITYLGVDPDPCNSLEVLLYRVHPAHPGLLDHPFYPFLHQTLVFPAFLSVLGNPGHLWPHFVHLTPDVRAHLSVLYLLAILQVLVVLGRRYLPKISFIITYNNFGDTGLKFCICCQLVAKKPTKFQLNIYKFILAWPKKLRDMGREYEYH